MPAKVIVVVGQKGGPGKTTTTMNLAATAADLGRRVLVVDVDPQGSATEYAQKAGESLPFDFTEASLRDTAALARLASLDYDYVFVDTPGSLMEADANQALVPSADFAIVPFWGDPMGLTPFVNTVHRVLVPADTPYKVLLNKINRSRSDDWVQSIQRQLNDSGFPCFDSYITDYVHLADAPATGTVITHIASGDRREAARIARSAKAYLMVVQELESSLTEGVRA